MPPKLSTITLESFFLHLVDKVESARAQVNRKRSMQDEIRTLEFWRSIIAECLATFFYVFMVCGTQLVWSNVPNVHVNVIIVSMASGFSMATLAQCFGHISGAHVNPAVTLAMLVAQKVTPLRAVMYTTAQCGGAIAGAALLYGVSAPGHQGALGISTSHDALGPWQAFGVEFVLTFVVVFTFFATLDPSRRSLGSDALAIGISYMACSLTGFLASGASMNPARSLGPAFVMNKWKYHWVYWFGPLSGGVLAGLIYEYIFDTKKAARTLREALEDVDKESNTDDDYDDPDSKVSKYGATHAPAECRTQHYDNYRPAVNAYSPTPSSTYPASTESTYGGATHSAPVSNYAPSGGLYGSRYGTSLRGIPGRLDYGPGATKF